MDVVRDRAAADRGARVHDRPPCRGQGALRLTSWSRDDARIHPDRMTRPEPRRGSLVLMVIRGKRRGLPGAAGVATALVLLAATACGSDEQTSASTSTTAVS